MLSGPIAPSGRKLSSGKTEAVVVVEDVDAVMVAASGSQVPAVVDPGTAPAYGFFCLTATHDHYASITAVFASTERRNPTDRAGQVMACTAS